MSMDEVDEVESGGVLPFLRDPVGMFRRRWRWMLATAVIGVLATTAFVATLKPRYVAEASVLVERQQIPEDFVRATVEEDSLQRIDALVGRVLTHERLAELVEKHDLFPRLSGKIPRAEIVALTRQAIEITPAAGVNRSNRDSSRIFMVRFSAEDPSVAATVANEIAGLLPAESVRSRTKQAKLTTDFLRRQLEQADTELREQNAAIRQFKEQYRGELPAELQANLGKLDRLQEQRQSLALQIAEASNRVAQLAQGSAGGPGPNAVLLQKQAELARELSTKTDRHPTVVALRDEIARLEAEVGNLSASSGNDTANALVASERGTLIELRAQLIQTESSLRELDAQVSRTPSRQEALAALEEKASVLRETYVDFLRKVQEAELAQSLEAAQHGERVSVLNWAGLPTRPARSRLLFLALGLVGTFGAALGVGVVFEAFDPVLVNARQVEALAGLPVLGSVPRIS